ncbi:MAG TPA: acyl-CoA dehydrogenase family protein [Thermoanaerobaculales bacterium]|nr:acyl-CoA dehydrogenase family protein [Thermoanaerobaculales bacterium]HPA80033.1 acyl-CoA dehydrogenase family protein [Thermoanaerobaculales bacterium]HQL28939.1 acyl-CoA dehydrogenase family protein [Thermoanaerobaculales bacterium]HQN97440.1 acyl-CoA dehydrogenase family protein [Thermoanaerobaculales bacterium]HQP42980.1 acyl-CoA dehydrogenase family protein [Thermoanaerobaculales bacterium]
MRELLSPTNLDYQDRAREVAEKFVRPRAAELDRTGEYGWDILEALRSYRLTGIWIPEEYGGQGAGVLDICLVVEQLSRACGGVGVAYAVNALGSFPIVLGGTPEQKQKYLPPIVDGALIAFGLSEKASGSDAGSLRTTAIRDGSDYVLDGHKKWNTNGAVASTYTIYALTDPDKGMRGISAFILDKGTPGFSVGKREDTMGIRTVPVNELDFAGCRVPASQLLGGKEGGGFRNAMMTLDRARPGVAAQALGLAQGALEWALRYTSERRQFGQTVMSHQAIQFMLADMATQVEAARQLVYTSARAIDAGVKNINKIAAMAKVFATDTAMRVTTDAVQLFGGYGYCRDYPIEKYMRDAKITQIYEGTNQVQRLVIGRALTRELKELTGHLDVTVEHFPGFTPSAGPVEV